MSWYYLRQNNSGGSFDVDDKLTQSLYIEAKDHREAGEIAINLGCYFDGVRNDMDCPCCGDRWNEPDEYDEVKGNRMYAGKTVEEHAEKLVQDFGGIAMRPEILAKYPVTRLYYKNGDILEMYLNEAYRPHSKPTVRKNLIKAKKKKFNPKKLEGSYK